MCITLLNQTPQWTSYRWVNCPKFLRSQEHASLWGDHLRGLHHTAKSISVVCIAQQSQSLQCASHPVVKLHTAEWALKNSLVSSCFYSIGTIRRNPFRGEHSYHEKIVKWRMLHYTGALTLSASKEDRAKTIRCIGNFCTYIRNKHGGQEKISEILSSKVMQL